MHEFRSFTMPLRGPGLVEDCPTLGTLWVYPWVTTGRYLILDEEQVIGSSKFSEKPCSRRINVGKFARLARITQRGVGETLSGLRESIVRASASGAGGVGEGAYWAKRSSPLPVDLHDVVAG